MVTDGRNDSGLEDELVDALRRLMRSVDLHSRRLTEDFGLTGPQLAVLREAARSMPRSAAALARMLHLGAATLSGILCRLERRGYVRRERSAADRRAVAITVTDLGVEALQRGPSLLHERLRRNLRRMRPSDRAIILRSVQQLAAMMDVDPLGDATVRSAPRTPGRTASGLAGPKIIAAGRPSEFEDPSAQSPAKGAGAPGASQAHEAGMNE